MTADDQTLIAFERRQTLRAYLGAMWARRDFALALPVEQVRSRHQATLLGNLWHLVNPLLTVAVYYLIFGVILDVTRGVDNYVVWMMIGVFAFRYTQNCVVGGAVAISSNQGLMRSIRFPRALLPISVVLSKAMTYVFELMILAGVAILRGEYPTWRWLTLPAIVAVHSLFNLGGAFIAARLNDSYRDVEQIIPFMFRLLTYLSGVMFPIAVYINAEDHGRVLPALIDANPLVGLLDLYRWALMGVPFSVVELSRVAIWMVVLLIGGFAFFRSAETRYGRA